MRPKGLDLYSGAGGASFGYHLAGFDMTGVDNRTMRNYPFHFIQADALEYVAEHGQEYAFVAASPPCQAYSVTRHSHGKEHPDLLGPTRDLLIATGLPWVIENVVGAPMTNYVELCGAAFGLEATDEDEAPLVLRRHRLFETNWMVWNPPQCECARYRRAGVMVGGVYGAGPSNRAKTPWKGYGHRRGGYTPKQHVRAELMGIDWMTQAELSQAIPPAYTKWLGERLIASLEQVS